MPAVRYYEVMETRVVKVRANEAVEAAKIGTSAFSGEITKRTDGQKIVDSPRVIALETKEVR